MITKGLMTSNKDNWKTPRELFNKLNNKYHFTLDACADDNNHLCNKYYTKENSCLDKSWNKDIVFINPPYGRQISDFVQKCWIESVFFGTKIVALLPARTDTQWFHLYIYNLRNVKIEFIKGRLKFDDQKNPAPFPSMLVYFNLHNNNIDIFNKT